MRNNITIFILGVFCGVFLVKLLSYNESRVIEEEITTEQVSGEKIEQKKWLVKGKSITFETQAAGRGIIKTKIPKLIIPEAYKWIKKTNAIQVNLYYMDNNVYGSVSYWYRWNRFSLGAGIILSGRGMGFQIGSQFWF